MLVVRPRDNDRFCVQINKAIEILQQLNRIAQFTSQFQLLLRRLAEWLKVRRDVRDAYLTLRDGDLAFVVIKKSPQYDKSFEDALSELDLSIANDAELDLIRLDAISLPAISAGALESFLHPDLRMSFAPHGN